MKTPAGVLIALVAIAVQAQQAGPTMRYVPDEPYY